MNLFLTEDEKRELTGYRRPKEQRAWLTRAGIPYYQNASGKPVVLREALHDRTARTGHNQVGRLSVVRERRW